MEQQQKEPAFSARAQWQNENYYVSRQKAGEQQEDDFKMELKLAAKFHHV